MASYQECALEHLSNTSSFGGDVDEDPAGADGGDALNVVLSQAVIECTANKFQEQTAFLEASITSWLLVVCGALVFMMQAGFAMLCAGCVRKKNVQNTMLKNLLDACGAALAFYALGYAFSFGGQFDDDHTTDITFVGTKNFFTVGGNVDGPFVFFQYTFSATAVTIVAGTLAERCQMGAYFLYSLVLSGFVYPVVVHSIWSNNGFLSAFVADPLEGIGVIDFAGSGVVHLTGGTTALIATYILGPRKGRFYDNYGFPLPTPTPMRGHSVALQLVGTMILWFGWYGFNCGSALLFSVRDTGKIASLVATNTSLCAATGALATMITKRLVDSNQTTETSFEQSRHGGPGGGGRRGGWFKHKKQFNLTAAMNGALSGMVASAATCGTVDPFASCLIGVIAGWIYLYSSSLLLRLRLDDAVDAIPVHMFNGIWGLVAVGLFSSPSNVKALYGNDDHVGWFFSLGRQSFDAILLRNQVLACLMIMSWVAIVMCPFFIWLDSMHWFRSALVEELIGLDVSYHNVEFAPDEKTREELKAAFGNKNNEETQ